MHITPLRPPPPPALAARRLRTRPGLAWLDGGLRHGREGRFSFVGAEPIEVRRGDWGALDPYTQLGALTVPLAPPELAPAGFPLTTAELPRWIGYLAYDASWAARPHPRHPRSGAPLFRFARYPSLYVFDHQTEQGFVAGEDERAVAQLETALRGPDRALLCSLDRLEATERAAHERAIASALELIAAGDVYMINLARRFQARFAGDPLALAARMRALSPVPFGFFFDAGDHAVIGRSMERFLRWSPGDGRLVTRPIKGTVRDEQESTARRALCTDPKELAEHAMLVDLMRNDLGRVARFGTVAVEELMSVQPYRGLSHLVSTIAAQTAPTLQLADLLAATFPPGSVTGTPKERAIARIEELEPHARGVYTGAYGFVDRGGGLSLSVAIRTALVRGDRAEYWAGGGIVADSRPARELEETELKARVFVDALND